jgi:multisubunit Na+/H+ antiporter MnhB subunit
VVEGERLYVWALTVAVLGMLMRKEREHLLPGVMLATAVLAIADMFTGNPFTDPVPKFLSQYAGYAQAMYQGGTAADMAWQGMEAARRFFYGSWFMWVHPPLLYFSYGAFTLSFVATVQMIRQRHSSFETVAYGWARLGYLPLTAGMLLGFPWAIEAWTGESWWWSGFVNMSIMMWLLYTAYLHARLYLRRRHMWQAVAVLAVLSFAVLIPPTWRRTSCPPSYARGRRVRKTWPQPHSPLAEEVARIASLTTSGSAWDFALTIVTVVLGALGVASWARSTRGGRSARSPGGSRAEATRPTSMR